MNDRAQESAGDSDVPSQHRDNETLFRCGGSWPMSVIVDRRGAGGYVERRHGDSSLADVVDLILDKGMIIDIFVRVSLLGLEILTIDIRIVVASVDTFLQFAEATNRSLSTCLRHLLAGITE